MFSLTKPARDDVGTRISAASRLALMQSEFLDVDAGLKSDVPVGYAHDCSRSQLGRGRQTFDAAIRALEHWKQFDLGWVHVADPDARISPGQIVAMLAHTLGLWTVSLSQVVQVDRSGNTFGFLYKTTADHVEEGEERFVLRFGEDENVWYEIEAVSRPRHVLARLAFPLARIFQHRFVRESHRRMREPLLGIQSQRPDSVSPPDSFVQTKGQSGSCPTDNLEV
jgi:uncharacterized protein (UPF0548 family)